jgi:nicotinamidase/pyrazinamidase
MKNRVVLIVDMINDFVTKGGALYLEGSDKLVKRLDETLKDEWDKNHPLFIFACDCHKENDPEFNLFPKHAIEDTWGAEIAEGIFKPEYHFIVDKTTYDSFYGTDLENIIRTKSNHINRSEHRIGMLDPRDVEVFVVGVCTSICVMDTVAGMWRRGFKPIVMKDLCMDLTLENHMKALARMEALYNAEIG